MSFAIVLEIVGGSARSPAQGQAVSHSQRLAPTTQAGSSYLGAASWKVTIVLSIIFGLEAFSVCQHVSIAGSLEVAKRPLVAAEDLFEGGATSGKDPFPPQDNEAGKDLFFLRK